MDTSVGILLHTIQHISVCTFKFLTTQNSNYRYICIYLCNGMEHRVDEKARSSNTFVDRTSRY